MLMGVAFSAAFANMLQEERLSELMDWFHPILAVTVQKFLGLTLLPHSGVSLVFTGIISSVLAASKPELASIVTGTIAAAAVINEIIAVIVAKKGFELAGEIHA